MKKALSQIATYKFLTFLLFTFILISCGSNEKNLEVEEELSLTEAEIVLSLVNKARLDAGLNILILNEALNTAAYEHSLDMETNEYFSHTSLDGTKFSSRAINAGYKGSPTGENIANGQRSAEAAFTSWINSEGHKANILNANATDMGLGLSGFYWTQVFGNGN